MPLAMFDTTEIIAFAHEIIHDLQEACPNTPEPATKKSIEKNRKKIDIIIARVDRFAKEKRPNIYKKAKFLNTLKWTLKETGYDPLFVDEAVRLLAVVMH